MSLVDLFVIVLFVLAVARVTRLINIDEVTDPVRIAVANRFGVESKASYFLSCPWCVGMWLALIFAPFVLLALALPLWWWPLLALATSHLVGLLAGLDGTDVEIEVESD